MKPRIIVSIVIAAVVAGGLAFGIGQFVGNSPGIEATEKPETPPKPTGPQPKAVADEIEHAFGSMEVGETRDYTFTIRNEGEATLELKNGGSSCSCTVNELTDSRIEPGGSAPVTLTWTPKAVDFSFKKTATVETNDPFRPKITFTISGLIDQKLNFEPASSWDVGTVVGGSEVTVQGRVFTRLLDDFSIEFEHDDDIRPSEPEPMTEEALKLVDAKAGYTYQVVVPAEKANAFTREFKVRTSVDGGTEHQMKVVGHATGPVLMMPIGNVAFHRKANALDLGRFSTTEGSSARLAMIFRDIPEEGLKIATVSVDPEYLEVTIKRDATYRVPNKARYVISLEIPAGSPSDTRTGENSAKVVLATGHPDLGELEFFIKYVAE